MDGSLWNHKLNSTTIKIETYENRQLYFAIDTLIRLIDLGFKSSTNMADDHKV